MEQLFYSIVIYGALSATFYLILTKHRIINYLQTNAIFPINKVANCVLCSCFWLSMFIALAGVCFGNDLITLLAPFASAGVARNIIG